MAGHPERPSATDPVERMAEHQRYKNLATSGLLGYGEADRGQLQTEYDILHAEQLGRMRQKIEAYAHRLCGWTVMACGGIASATTDVVTHSFEADGIVAI